MRRVLLSLFLSLIVSPAFASTASLLGVYNTDNVPALTLGYTDQYGNFTGGSVIFKGGTSGTTTLQPNAVAGTSVLTLPTEAADTLVDLTGTQTLTNKSLTSPTITGNVATQGTAFSTGQAGNPLQLMTVQNITAASVNTANGYTFVKGVNGRTIWPGSPTVMVSGTAAGATTVYLACSGGNLLASFPIAALTTNKPTNAFASTGTNSPIGGVALGQGCAVSDGVLVSVVGSALTTTTNFYVNLPYTVQ